MGPHRSLTSARCLAPAAKKSYEPNREPQIRRSCSISLLIRFRLFIAAFDASNSVASIRRSKRLTAITASSSPTRGIRTENSPDLEPTRPRHSIRRTDTGLKLISVTKPRTALPETAFIGTSSGCWTSATRPSGFLFNSLQLSANYRLLAGRHQLRCENPVRQRNARASHNGADCDGERLCGSPLNSSAPIAARPRLTVEDLVSRSAKPYIRSSGTRSR